MQSELLTKCIEFATSKHDGQFRHNGRTPYIHHPLAVMDKVVTEEEKVVAILHDVLEDTDATVEDLVDLGISRKCIQAIELLTKHEDQAYLLYIHFISENPLALTVKVADIAHNLSDSPSRSQIDKYAKAIGILSKVYDT